MATPSTPQRKIGVGARRSPRPAEAPRRVRGPLMRAILPVAGGILVLGLIALMLWGIAAYISRGDAETSERLAPSQLQVGSTRGAADIIVEDGPILFPGLGTTTGERTLVLDHTGDDLDSNWSVYFAYPAGGDPTCTVEQIIGTREFVDCDGNTIEVEALSPPPPGVNPVVSNGQLSIDLSGVTDG